MIWNSEPGTIWFQPNARTLNIEHEHKMLHIQKRNNEYFEWFIFVLFLFYFFATQQSMWVKVTEIGEEDAKKRWIFKSCAMRFCRTIIAAATITTTKALYCFSVLLFNFHFTIISFSFSFGNENRRSTIYFVCSEFGAKCVPRSISSALVLACARLSLSVQVHFARHSHPKEPVIEKVRKHCFSDKGIALSTRMIYLVNISIVFSDDAEQYHMCLESTWIQA